MTIEEMLVKLKADNKDFKAKMQEAKKTASDTAGKVDKALDGMGKNAGKAAGGSIAKTLAKTRALRDELKKIREQAKQAAGVKPSDVYRQTTADIEKMSAALDKLKAKQAKTSAQLDAVGATGKGLFDQRKALRGRLDALKAEQMEQYGPDPSKSIYANKSKEWKAMQKEIDATQAKIDALSAKLKTVDQKDLQLSDEFNRLQAEIDEATVSLDKYNAKKAQMEASGAATNSTPLSGRGAFVQAFNASDAIPPGLKKIVSMMNAVGKTTAATGSRFMKFGRTAVSAVRGVTGWLGKLASGFGKVFSKIPLLGKLNGQLGKMKKGLFAGMGMRGMLRFGAMGYGIMSAVRGMREGFGNLSQYSSQTESSLNSLKSSLLTLKNAFATAFAPILNIVAPILAKVIDWITGAATAVAHLVAALTGKSTVVVARKAVSGVASGISNTGSAAKGAKKNIDEYKKSLMGFDQINKLDDQNDSGGSGGSGGGGGGAGAAGSMFDTVEVGKDAKGLADMIKEAWANADFTELGEMVGTKLNEALAKIPWDKIQETSRKIAKSIATFLNGFIRETDWTLVGKTIAEGLNTAIYFAETFVTTFDWGAFGKAIADALIGAIENIDWAALSRTIGGLVGGVFRTLVEIVKEIGGEVAEGFQDGIWEGIKGIGKWITDHIFKPFIDGFKKAFGIASPSKVMKEQGGYLIDGLLQGIEDKLDDIKAWFMALPGKIQSWVGNIVIDFKARLTTWADSLSDKIVDFKARLTTWFDALKEKIVDFRAKLTTWSDALKEKIVSFKAKLTAWADALSNKVVNFAAKLTSWHDALKNKVISFTAKMTSWKDSLRNKVINFVANITGGGGSSSSSKKSSKKKKKKKKADGGIYYGGSWHPVTTAAAGGAFNEGQMFIAREAGPELVGTIGGHTAVMNNAQIVSSVAAGVYKAVAAAMGNGGNTNVNVTLSADAAQMFRIMQEQAQDYTNTTGLSAFPI